MRPSKKIIIFDGICVLCNSWVDFIIKRDRDNLFRFSPLQSNAGKALLEKFSIDIYKSDSLVLIDENRYFIKSGAVLHIVDNLHYPWRIFYVFRFIPRFLRDFIYDFIAKYRYKLFGKRKSCRLPVGAEKERFIL